MIGILKRSRTTTIIADRMWKVVLTASILLTSFTFHDIYPADPTNADNDSNVSLKRSYPDTPTQEPARQRKKEDSSIVNDSKEAILWSSIDKLTDTHRKIFSKRLNAEAELYTCDNKTFDDLFPISPLGTFDLKVDKSSFAGQIRYTTSDRGIGSGTIIGMAEEKNGDITITGITALHHIVSLDQGKDINRPSPGDRKFVMGSKRKEDKKETELGFVKINKVMVPHDPQKDMCLFKGTLIPNEKIFDSRKTFLNHFSPYVPSIIEDGITKTDPVPSTIYHYPLGRKDQRINSGDAYVTFQLALSFR